MEALASGRFEVTRNRLEHLFPLDENAGDEWARLERRVPSGFLPLAGFAFAIFVLFVIVPLFSSGCATTNVPTVEEVQLDEEQQVIEPDPDVVVDTVVCTPGELVKVKILDVIDRDAVVYEGELSCSTVKDIGPTPFRGVIGEDKRPRIYRIERAQP